MQYNLQLVPRSGPVAVQKVAENQFVLAPAYFGERLSLILSRFGR